MRTTCWESPWRQSGILGCSQAAESSGAPATTAALMVSLVLCFSTTEELLRCIHM